MQYPNINILQSLALNFPLRRAMGIKLCLKEGQIGGLKFWGKSCKQKDVAGIFRRLAHLLAAGISLQKALLVLGRGTSPDQAAAIAIARQKLLEGKSARQALADFPHVTEEIGGLIGVGEETADLARVFLDISTYFEDRLRLKSKIMRALSYPALVIMVCLVALFLIMVFLLPNFKTLFESSNVKLPAITRFLIEVGVFLQKKSGMLLLMAVALPFLVKAAGRRKKVRDSFQVILLKIPGISKMIYVYFHLRVVKVLATLLAARLPLTVALGYVQRVCPHPVFTPVFSSIIKQIENGASFAQAVVAEKKLSPLLKEVAQVAEESGNFPQMLLGLGQVFEEELEGQLRSATMLVEPLATILVGGLVGLVAISMLYPMTELMNSIR